VPILGTIAILIPALQREHERNRFIEIEQRESKETRLAVLEIEQLQRGPLRRVAVFSMSEKQHNKNFPLDSYAYSLARIRWDVFGTLTFRSVPSPNRAYGRAWALMRRAAELVQRSYSQLLIALRAELGEMTGRFHFHFLLGGTKTRNEITLAHQLEHGWFGLFGQGAISKCRPYDRSRAGVAYVTKCLGQGTWGANEYEVRKFNLADTVTLSKSVFRVIRSLDRMGIDAAARTCEKTGLR